MLVEAKLAVSLTSYYSKRLFQGYHYRPDGSCFGPPGTVVGSCVCSPDCTACSCSDEGSQPDEEVAKLTSSSRSSSRSTSSQSSSRSTSSRSSSRTTSTTSSFISPVFPSPSSAQIDERVGDDTQASCPCSVPTSTSSLPPALFPPTPPADRGERREEEEGNEEVIRWGFDQLECFRHFDKTLFSLIKKEKVKKFMEGVGTAIVLGYSEVGCELFVTCHDSRYSSKEVGMTSTTTKTAYASWTLHQ